MQQEAGLYTCLAGPNPVCGVFVFLTACKWALIGGAGIIVATGIVMNAECGDNCKNGGLNSSGGNNANGPDFKGSPDDPNNPDPGNNTQPPLKRIHSDDTTKSGNSSSYNYWSNKSTNEIVRSLRPGQEEPLTVKPDGRVYQGNTRILILEERGFNINSLPREIIP
ncbi:MAG: hypothetical protein IPP10_15120 [Candidatus Competibacteraceae bacterium]|nr:hypothetical protein [Candidatus Competibacteraceae bacterium]